MRRWFGRRRSAVSEPVERLSEVLVSLQDLAEGESVGSVAGQVVILREVQAQMQLQLRLHDAQIAALREVIDLLSRRAAP